MKGYGIIMSIQEAIPAEYEAVARDPYRQFDTDRIAASKHNSRNRIEILLIF